MTLSLQWLDGETRLVGIIGDPVAQARSPGPLTGALQARGVNAVNLPLHVRPQDLAAVVGALRKIPNVVGHILTVPHKFAGLALVDRLSPTAAAAGAVNVIRREADGAWLGDNFDGAGIVDGLLHDGFDPAGKAVFIAGAGGAGCAVAAALAAHGAERLRIFDIAAERVAALKARLGRHFPGVAVEALTRADPGGVDIAVNATPLGMHAGDAVPFDVAALRPGALVAEVVMKPPVTQLLQGARAAGHPVALGENVLTFQLPRCAAFFAGACAGTSS
ncbi:MAG: shikimate dehydrogenase [Flavobacteriaceae bacterium]